MNALPFLTAELPGIGGRLRARPNHFCVEEIPLRAPKGHGEYLRVLIEKTRRSTPEVLRLLAKCLRLSPRDLHAAGNKDADATTRQWISMPARVESMLHAVRIDRVTLLDGDLDPEPLGTGELAGNRFEIAVSGLTDPELAERLATPILQVLTERGVPAFFGAQRFGTRGISADIGGAFLRGEYEAAIDLLLGGMSDLERDPAARLFRQYVSEGDLKSAFAAVPPGLGLERSLVFALSEGVAKKSLWKRIPFADRRMLLSAWQSRIFNRIVAARLDSLDRVVPGDILIDERTRELRPSGDGEVEASALRGFRVSPTGWMPGDTVAAAPSEQGAIEAAAFESDTVPRESLDRPLDLTLPGERRPLRVRLADCELGVDRAERVLWLRFRLPPGAFATTVLGEVRKIDPPPL